MKLVDLLQPQTPPAPRGARVVTLLGPPLEPDNEERRKARERWQQMKREWNRRRKERGWPK